MDDEPTHAVLSPQLDDLNRLLDPSAHVNDHVDVSDIRIALISCRDELAARLRSVQDRRMGRSIARAVLHDEPILRQARSQENSAIRDRSFACRMCGARNESPRAPIIDGTDSVDDMVMTGFAQLNLALPEEPDLMEVHAAPQSNTPSHSAGRAFGPVQPLHTEAVLDVQKTCESCSEHVSYSAAVSAPCGHDYCQNCAKQLFLNSMRDESLFPPRCCHQPIPLAAIDVFLTAEFINHFEEKAVEFSTSNRLYCAWPTCSTFIPPTKINGDIAICPKCDFWVCALCKGHAHQGRDCPKDAGLDALMSTATKEGWQCCYRCKRFIELDLGCNHIT